MQETIPSIYDKTVFAVLKELFATPHGEFHLRGLAKATGLSTTAISRAIAQLEQEAIITVTKTNITTRIRVDLESAAYTRLKKLFNLSSFLPYIDHFLTVFQPEALILFGSYAKGEDIEGSDIDLCILSLRKEPEDFRLALEKIEKELNRTFSLHILNGLDKAEPAFRNAIANGIVLHGYVKVC